MKRLQILCLCLLFCVLAHAQTSQGTIAGTVTDPSGAAVAGATVTAKNVTGSDNRTVKTGSKGEYRIETVNPSTYLVTVDAPGFQTQNIERVIVTGSVVTSVNATLQVGSVSTTVNVESSTALVQTDSGEISHSISSREVADMPIPTGNPIDLVLTEPGVVSVAMRDNLTNGEAFSVDGLRPRANNFLIDGFDDNDYGITGQALQPSNTEAIKEVVSMTNGYSAEFGRGGASITNVIYKNGTNEYHGSLWERYSAAGLNAIPVELKNSGYTDNPNFVNNLYGFTVGGPIIKNKLFAFGSGQWDRENEDESGGQLTVPTAAGVAALNAIGNANAKTLVASLGGLVAPSANGSINVGNRAGCGDPCMIDVGQVIRSPKALSRSHEDIVRVDFTPTDKDTFSVRYLGSYSSLNPDLFANPDALPTQDTEQGGPARNTGGIWTHSFTPTLVNEARFTAQQINFAFAPLASTTSNPLYALPNFTFVELPGASYGGSDSTFPQGRGHDTYEYQDGLSFTFGSHSIKFGTDIVHVSINDLIPFNNRGAISFEAGGDCSAIGLDTCTSLANYLDDFTGPSGSVGKSFGTARLVFPDTIQAYYIQDTWKARKNLTLDFGLRYEDFGTPSNALPYPAVLPGAGALTQGLTQRVTQQPDRNNFGPRFGFAYAAGDKTVLRGGFGVFYDLIFSNIPDNTASTSPNSLGGTIVAPTSGRGDAAAIEMVSAVTATVDPFATQEAILSNIVNPMTYQWNFNIERQLPGNTLFTVAYVGTRGERLLANEHLNPIVDPLVGDRLNPDRGAIVARSNLGDSVYHGLDISAERRFTHGLMFRGAFTWSKSLDDVSDVFVTSGSSSYPQDLLNQRGDWGPSAFDRKFRTSLSFMYQTPSWKSNSAVANVLSWPVRDWEVAGLFSWQTGAPETISLDGYDQNGDGSASNDRPNLSNPSAPINFTPACQSDPTCITGFGQVNPDGTLTDWYTGAPGTASQFRYIATNVEYIGPNGNVGRNTFYNPGRQDYDLSVMRIIKTRWEGKQFELRADALDVFNHPNAGGGTSQDGSTASSVSGDLLSPTFLNKDITYEGGRALQLWLKFRF